MKTSPLTAKSVAQAPAPITPPQPASPSAALLQFWRTLPIKAELVDELSLSIKALGLLEPIKRLHGVVVDGRHRELACKKAGVLPRYLDLKAAALSHLSDDADPMGELFVAQNIVRHHLSLGERSLIAASYASLQKGANQHTAEAARFSRKALSAMFAVSEDTIDRGKTLLASGRADLIDNVKRGCSPARAVRLMEVERAGARLRHIARGTPRAAKTMESMAGQQLNIGLLLADPPWQFSARTSSQQGAPEHHYPTMPLEAIKALPVGKLMADDALCCLWVPNFMIPEGLDVLKAWGFGHYVTCMVWVKSSHNVSPGAILSCHETLLIAKRGAGLPKLGDGIKRARSWHLAPVTRHSEKPAHFADEIERLYPRVAKLEMFARTPRKGWLSWGNQVVSAIDGGKAANDDAEDAGKRGKRSPVRGAKKP